MADPPCCLCLEDAGRRLESCLCDPGVTRVCTSRMSTILSEQPLGVRDAILRRGGQNMMKSKADNHRLDARIWKTYPLQLAYQGPRYDEYGLWLIPNLNLRPDASSRNGISTKHAAGMRRVEGERREGQSILLTWKYLRGPSFEASLRA